MVKFHGWWNLELLRYRAFETCLVTGRRHDTNLWTVRFRLIAQSSLSPSPSASNRKQTANLFDPPPPNYRSPRSQAKQTFDSITGKINVWWIIRWIFVINSSEREEIRIGPISKTLLLRNVTVYHFEKTQFLSENSDHRHKIIRSFKSESFNNNVLILTRIKYKYTQFFFSSSNRGVHISEGAR